MENYNTKLKKKPILCAKCMSPLQIQKIKPDPAWLVWFQSQTHSCLLTSFEFFDPTHPSSKFSKIQQRKNLSLSLAMAPHFVFPQSLRELEEDHEDNRLYAQNSTDVASLRSSELEEFVKGFSLSLTLSHFLNNSVWLLRKWKWKWKRNSKLNFYSNFDSFCTFIWIIWT